MILSGSAIHSQGLECSVWSAEKRLIGGLQIGERATDTALELALCEGREEALDRRCSRE
jgi:hypothetical protein